MSEKHNLPPVAITAEFSMTIRFWFYKALDLPGIDLKICSSL